MAVIEHHHLWRAVCVCLRRHRWEERCYGCGAVRDADSDPPAKPNDEPRDVVCPECDGNGFPADYPNRACRMCFGTGKVTEVRREYDIGGDAR